MKYDIIERDLGPMLLLENNSGLKTDPEYDELMGIQTQMLQLYYKLQRKLNAKL